MEVFRSVDLCFAMFLFRSFIFFSPGLQHSLQRRKMGSDNEPKMQANGMPDMDAKEKAGSGLVMLLAMIVIPLGIGFGTACAIHSYGNTSAYEKVVAFLSVYRSTQTHAHLHTHKCVFYINPLLANDLSSACLLSSNILVMDRIIYVWPLCLFLCVLIRVCV